MAQADTLVTLSELHSYGNCSRHNTFVLWFIISNKITITPTTSKLGNINDYIEYEALDAKCKVLCNTACALTTGYAFLFTYSKCKSWLLLNVCQSVGTQVFTRLYLWIASKLNFSHMYLNKLVTIHLLCIWTLKKKKRKKKKKKKKKEEEEKKSLWKYYDKSITTWHKFFLKCISCVDCQYKWPW